MKSTFRIHNVLKRKAERKLELSNFMFILVHDHVDNTRLWELTEDVDAFVKVIPPQIAHVKTMGDLINTNKIFKI